jgi:hypothetical protein
MGFLFLHGAASYVGDGLFYAETGGGMRGAFTAVSVNGDGTLSPTFYKITYIFTLRKKYHENDIIPLDSVHGAWYTIHGFGNAHS